MSVVGYNILEDLDGTYYILDTHKNEPIAHGFETRRQAVKYLTHRMKEQERQLRRDQDEWLRKLKVPPMKRGPL